MQAFLFGQFHEGLSHRALPDHVPPAAVFVAQISVAASLTEKHLGMVQRKETASGPVAGISPDGILVREKAVEIFKEVHGLWCGWNCLDGLAQACAEQLVDKGVHLLPVVHPIELEPFHDWLVKHAQGLPEVGHL